MIHHSSREQSSSNWGEFRASTEKSTRVEPLIGDLRVLSRYSHILIVGGTFDPFTLAHLSIPQQCAAAVGAEAVLYVPAKQSPLKTNRAIASDSDRLNMICGALTETQPTSPFDLLVAPFELERQGASYTAEALSFIKGYIPGTKLSLFLGSDSVSNFHRWRAVDSILALADPVIVLRGENKNNLLHALRENLTPEQVAQLESAIVSAISGSSISATTVRNQIASGAGIPQDLLPLSVARYIALNSLYI